jgi:hypothetical protein
VRSSIGIAGAPIAGVVEEDVEPSPFLLHLREEGLDRFGLRNVGRNREGAVARARFAHRLIEVFLPPRRERDAVAFLQQRERRGFPDPRARARDDCDFAGHLFPLFLFKRLKLHHEGHEGHEGTELNRPFRAPSEAW